MPIGDVPQYIASDVEVLVTRAIALILLILAGARIILHD